MSRINSFLRKLDTKEWKITAFYPYTTSTVMRLFNASSNSETEEATLIRDFTQHFKNLAKDDLGIQWDNKVVLKIEYVSSFVNTSHEEYTPLYLGYYDGGRSIALGIYQQSRCTTSCNKVFE